MQKPKLLISALLGFAALLGTSTAHAQCLSDSFEPNNNCATASLLNPGSYQGLTVNGYSAAGGLKEDFYAVTVGVGEELTLDIAWDGNQGLLQLWLYDDGICGAGFVDADTQGFNGFADVYYNNVTTAPVSLVCKVRTPTPSTVCVDYDMNLAIGVNPCNSTPDDPFEDNDTCLTPTLLTPGTLTGLAVFGAGHVNGEDKDFYLVQGVPAGHVISIDVTYNQAVGDIGLGLLNGSCGGYELYSNYQGGFENITVTNFSGSAADYWFEIVGYDSAYDCGTYDLTTTVFADPCNSLLEDSFAPNQNCALPAPLTAGAHTGLQVFYQSGDYFAIAVQPGKRLEVDALFAHSSGNIDMRLLDSSCTNTLRTAASWTDNEHLAVTNSTASVVTYTLEVSMPYSNPNCNGYDLNVSIFDEPCLATDDVYYPNFTCGSGTPLSPGVYPNLFVSKFVSDYFQITVAPGATLNATIDCVAANGNVIAFLYDPLFANCDQQSYLASAHVPQDSKTLTFTNTDAVSRIYELELLIRDYETFDCNAYSLTLSGALGQSATALCFGDGTNVGCPCGNQSPVGAGAGCMNSQGHGAILTALGTNLVSSDDLSFAVQQARPSQPGMLLQGATQIAVPFKDGILCTGNPTERLEVIFLDGSGAGASTISIVTEGNITPGLTRYYQQWYRDPSISQCGTGSNLSNALEVIWL